MESDDKCEFTVTCVIGIKELLLLLFKGKKIILLIQTNNIEI